MKMAAPAHPTQGVIQLSPNYYGAGVVTPSDSQPIFAFGYVRGLYAVSSGNIAAIGADGNAFTIAVPANFILPIAVTQVKASGTTVTGGNLFYLL
jgi:hypothetical protein